MTEREKPLSTLSLLKIKPKPLTLKTGVSMRIILKCLSLAIVTMGSLASFASTNKATAKSALKAAATKEESAAAHSTAQNSAGESKTVAIEPAINTVKNNFYVSVNFVDLTKGSPNLNADLFVNETTAANFRFRSNSNREEVKNPDNANDKQKLTVEGTAFSIGASFFPLGTQNKINLIASPGLAFGSKKSSLDVENQMGVSLKVSALIKTNNKFAVEMGLRGDNLEDASFTTDLYAGFGLLF